jgi:hypothetical protein
VTTSTLTECALTFCGNGINMALMADGALIGAAVSYVEPVGTLPTDMYMGCDSAGANQCNSIIDEFRVSKYPAILIEHQYFAASVVPMRKTSATTLLYDFDAPAPTALVSGDELTLTETITWKRFKATLTANAGKTLAPVIESLTWTLSGGSIPGKAMAYKDKTVEVGIRDSTGHTERWRGKIWKPQPGIATAVLIASSGDQVLADRLISKDYASADLGATLIDIITTDCTPLVDTGISATLGYTGALSLLGRQALDAFDAVRKRYGILYYLYYDGIDWIPYVLKRSELTAPTTAVVWGHVFEPPNCSIVRFLDEPKIGYTSRDATTVKVIVKDSSPEVSGTASLTDIAAADEIERVLYIDAGDAAACTAVATAWLAIHGYDQITVSGMIPLNTGLSFGETVWASIPQAGINQALPIQRKVHRPKAQPPHTEIALGEFLPAEEEILARNTVTQ